MSTKHTPGPWVAYARTNAHISIEAPAQSGYVARGVATVSFNNHEANARLIAAAPELLNAVRFLLNNPDNRISRADRDAANAVITKATGA